MTFNEKPYYQLYPKINCAGIVYVNDIPVFKFLGKDTEDGLMDGAVPINHILLQSGKHQIIGKMLPRHNHEKLTENDGMSINFKVSDYDNWKDTRAIFSPEIKNPDAYFDKDNTITSSVKGLPEFKINTEIEIELPFVLDGWQNSLDLSKTDKDNLFTQVLAVYRQIHAVLKEHNAVKFLELSKEKEDLQTKAFYFDNKKKEEIRSSILNLFTKNLEVLPLNSKDLKLQLWGYGKLVTLQRFDGTSALQFKRDIDKGERNIELEVKLHKRNKESGFTII